jgi:hypothetical protein
MANNSINIIKQQADRKEYRQALVLRLMARQYSFSAIVDKLKEEGFENANRTTVRKDIQEAKELLLQDSYTARFDKEEEKRAQIESTKEALAELWEVWKLSKEIGEPNINAMREIRENMAEIRKIMGLYDNPKLEISGVDGAPLFDYDRMTEEELEKELIRLQKTM